MECEWDAKNAALNLNQHGVSFQEAATVFADPLSITAPDPDHSFEENRYIISGQSHRGRLLIVSHTERDDRFRIISAGELTRKEMKAYEEEDFI